VFTIFIVRLFIYLEEGGVASPRPWLSVAQEKAWCTPISVIHSNVHLSNLNDAR